jgi:hypothetical protein
MQLRNCLCTVGLTLVSVAAPLAYGGDAAPASAVPAVTSDGLDTHKLAGITPGVSTKQQIQTLLGKPWRILQFNDCGHAMPNQADETWEYRGSDANGPYRLHVEFDEHDVAHLVARIPDRVAGGKGTAARVSTTVMAHNDHHM